MQHSREHRSRTQGHHSIRLGLDEWTASRTPSLKQGRYIRKWKRSKFLSSTLHARRAINNKLSVCSFKPIQKARECSSYLSSLSKCFRILFQSVLSIDAPPFGCVSTMTNLRNWKPHRSTKRPCYWGIASKSNEVPQCFEREGKGTLFDILGSLSLLSFFSLLSVPSSACFSLASPPSNSEPLSRPLLVPFT